MWVKSCSMQTHSNNVYWLELFSFQLSVTSDFAMYIHVAVHFRSGFSGDEIQTLGRLSREGSPERLSRS